MRVVLCIYVRSFSIPVCAIVCVIEFKDCFLFLFPLFFSYNNYTSLCKFCVSNNGCHLLVLKALQFLFACGNPWRVYNLLLTQLEDVKSVYCNINCSACGTIKILTFRFE